MPPGTTIRSVRVNDDLWFAALDVAQRQGKSLSDVIREALTELVARDEAHV